MNLQNLYMMNDGSRAKTATTTFMIMMPLSFFIVVSLGVSSTFGNADVTCVLISPDDPSPIIVVGADRTESERFAAEELSGYLKKITGRDVVVVDDSRDVPNDRKIIAVGKSRFTERYDIASLGVEQYIIDTTPNGIVIVGGREKSQIGADGARYMNDRGTLYGAYDFLESLGVRWYRPEAWGEHISKMQRIELPIGTATSPRPPYILRYGPSAIAFHRYGKRPEMREAGELWMVRNRLSAVTDDPRYGGTARYRFMHAYVELFPPAEYFDTHPEYYALIDGKRTTEGQLCLGNLELQDAFAEKIIVQTKAHPEWNSFSLEPNDGGGWCQCSLCIAMDDPETPNNMSNRVTAFNNIIARQVATEAPGTKLHWLAYSSRHTRVPTVVKRLEPDMIVMPATFNAWGNYSKKLHDPENALFLETLQGWYQLGPSAMMTYEYWSGYSWPGPMPVTRTIADRLKHYRKYKVEGIYNETHPQWGPQGLEQYMFAKLVWNPDLDVNRELNLYYQNYYGPAAVPMKAYHEALMDEIEKYDIRSGGRGMPLVMTPAFIEKLGKMMDQAKGLVKGQPLYERRLAGVAAGYEFSRHVSEIVEYKKANQQARAEQAFQELKEFLLSFNEGDAVFDISPKDRTSDKPVTYPLGYLTRDLGVTWKWQEEL